MNILKLTLCNPLLYRKNKEKERGEEMFCFELDPLEAQSIEPQANKLINNLIFHGFAANQDAEGGVEMTIPAGHYLFVQTRKNAAWDYLLMAVEAQKSGLWERLHLENQLFVRTLLEDGRKVTQIFRRIVSIV
jgi:hypothetical protein